MRPGRAQILGIQIGKTSLICLAGGQINDPHHIGQSLFSSAPPSNSLVPISDPWRAFGGDTAPFKSPRLASCVASKTTENQGQSRCAALGVRRSQDTVKNKYQRPSLSICLKHTYFCSKNLRGLFFLQAFFVRFEGNSILPKSSKLDFSPWNSIFSN